MKANWDDIDDSLEYFILDRQGQLASVYSSSLKNMFIASVSKVEKMIPTLLPFLGLTAPIK